MEAIPHYKQPIDNVRNLIAGYRPNDKDDLLAFQQMVASLISTARAVEMDMRKRIVDQFSDDLAPGHSGTEYVELGYGYALKIVHAVSYKVATADDNAATKAALDLIEKSEAGGYVIAERLIKWKPELSVSEYKKLSVEHKSIIDKVVTVVDSSPSIFLVAPK